MHKLIIALGIGLAVASPTAAASWHGPDLHALIEAHRRGSPKVRSEAIAVITPRGQWSAATGFVGKTPYTTAHTFRIASATKPFTAAAILRLHETGAIDITQPIGSYLSEASNAALRSAGYDPRSITIRQLLAHTSGLRDYATDPRFVAAVTHNPGHRWTRDEQLRLAMSAGGPLSSPGERYAYADTGYILLGEIIEGKTHKNLGAAVRQLLRFERLRLKHTWWERLEKSPAGTRIAPAYFGDTSMGEADPSFDLYGGGGLISTVSDLARFYRQLVRGEVFDHANTLAIMMTATGARRPDTEPGVHNNALSLFRVGRFSCWGHAGFWGQIVAHCPEADVTFAWTINQSEEERASAQRFLDRLAIEMAPQ